MTKQKKPFYKRFWFILLAIIVVLVLLLSFTGKKDDSEKIEWTDFFLGDRLPTPESAKGKVLTNSDEHLSVSIHKTSKDDYDAYRSACAELGFTIESDRADSSYSAYNADGYRLLLRYDDSDEELSISLDAPMEMDTLNWPKSDIAAMLPLPRSTVGKISSESSDGLYIYVGQTTKEDFAAYIDACSDAGFSVDYKKGETFYSADHADGYHLSLNYQGNGVMSIDIDAQEVSTDAAAPVETPVPAPETEPTPDAETPADTSDADAAPAEPEAPSAEVDTPAAPVGGLRPEFKAAMDSYEEFYDEYCDLLVEYNKNPTDLSLLTRYTDLMAQAVEMDAQFEQWNSENMNDAELLYFSEVSARVSQKLLEASLSISSS